MRAQKNFTILRIHYKGCFIV